MPNKETRVTIRLNDVQKKMLDDICQKLGTGYSEILREEIRRLYLKIFPAYRSAKQVIEQAKEEQLTPQQLCERLGGKVGKNNAGIEVCKFESPGGGIVYTVPITMTEKFQNAAKQAGI